MTIRKIAAIRRIAAKTHEGYIHTVNEFELWDVHGDTVITDVYPVLKNGPLKVVVRLIA